MHLFNIYSSECKKLIVSVIPIENNGPTLQSIKFLSFLTIIQFHKF